MDHSIQIIAGISVLILSLIIISVFWRVGRGAGSKEEYKAVAEKGYAIRRRYFKGLLIASLILFALGIYLFPYPELKEARATAEPFVVKVTASQFSFDISDEKVPLGPVRFDLKSTDVNHGFGIYDEKGWLVTQTQIMPDYVNRLYVTFKRPGRYKVWCLEYCGVAHHAMTSEFEVR